MRYDEAVSYVHSLLRFGVKPGLERMRAMMAELGNPQDKLKFAHVAGTNGKGSTCAMLAGILQASGYRTGLFTSPYVIEFRERIQINGEMIPHEAFASAMEQIKPVAERLAKRDMQPTEFEVITAAAFLYFAQVGCDIVVLEVGLGGRLDSTNIIKTPLVSVITSVSMDHMNVLGNTIEEIAAEKCGIVKRGGITVAYPEQDRRVFNILYHTAILQSNVLITQNMGDVRIEAERITGTDIVYNGLHIHIPLIGAHQVGNCMTAVLAAEALRSRGMRRITGRSIVSGIAVVLEVGLGGRLDSTNIIKTPLVSVITSVSMDHMNVLGNTIEEIAAEKCGIVKRGGITVAYPEQDRRVFNILYHTAILQSNVLITQNMGDVRIEAERITGTDIVYNGLHIHIPLIGAHQVGNCMTAVLAAEALRSRGMRRITGRSIVSGIAGVRIPARLEVFQTQPLVLLDGGHNEDGLQRLAQAVRKFLSGRRLIGVIGMMADKAHAVAAREIAPLCAKVIATTPSNPRATPAEQLAREMEPFCSEVWAEENPEEAFLLALREAQPEDAVLVCGSFYLASDVREALLRFSA